MVRKTDGKTALILLVEEAEGFQKFTEEEIAHLTREAQRFFKFLVRKQGSVYIAEEICERIREDTVRTLHIDWNDALKVSEARLYSDLATEVDIFAAQTEDPLRALDIEFTAEKLWDEHLGKVAYSASERPHWDRWQKALRNLEDFDQQLRLMEIIKSQQGKLEDADIRLIKMLARELNYHRFGVQLNRGRMFRRTRSLRRDGIFISYRMWAERRNRINRLLGNEKQYEEQKKKKEIDENQPVPEGDLKQRWDERLSEEVPPGDSLWYELAIYGMDVDLIGGS